MQLPNAFRFPMDYKYRPQPLSPLALPYLPAFGDWKASSMVCVAQGCYILTNAGFFIVFTQFDVFSVTYHL